jgi:hydroxymethylpyrimidine pyrophosphatase-like HAD family hydrolase
MLSLSYAGFLAAPANAVPQVKEAVDRQGGFVSERLHGAGVAEAIKSYAEGWVGVRI